MAPSKALEVKNLKKINQKTHSSTLIHLSSLTNESNVED
jgi:hypothetical protein